ncbi:MAG: hypothetical protein MR937_00525 [Spirochaetia bacterium]|nr:hypothetical protein [Spirochaetia bacterium]MCI5607846.1 hypothetical protein [Spirochaetia bacterium]MCI6825788.1 hypothetical protein [Spirochaetia bacterium]MCI7564295.1 hypothetical protein [Spirochaetia bacterium]
MTVPLTVKRQFWYLWNGSSGVCGMAVPLTVLRQLSDFWITSIYNNCSERNLRVKTATSGTFI